MNAFTLAPHVLHENLEGEVLAIDERTGTYFSIGGSGAGVFNLLISGAPLNSVTEQLIGRYPAAGDQISADLAAFARQLEELELLVPAPSSPVESAAPVAISESWTDDDWATPEIGVHSEMQDILLFDPVHQVDYDKGWPHAAEGS